MFVGPHYAWNDLDAEGRRVQSRLLNELETYSPLIEVLVRLAPEGVRKDVEQANKALREIADRTYLSWHSSVDAARTAAHDAVATQLAALEGLDDPSDAKPLYVPDASAVLDNPQLDDWAFDGVRRFVLMLTPPLLKELDDLKSARRDEAVRQTGDSVIKRIKDYRGRGDIFTGVTLRSGRSDVRLSAAEPDFAATLPWLDPQVTDDRYIAVALELMRRHPRSPVTIVASDINLQNKAAAARVPFVEPPPPTTPPAASQPKAPPLPDIRIVRFSDGDGSEGLISFRVDVQNFEPGPVIATAKANLDGEPVERVHPKELNLLANTTPTTVSVHLPRPALANLVKPFGDETTLYGRSLEVVISVDGRNVASRSWHEIVYSPEDNRARYEIQQQLWQLARGEATEAGERADAVRQVLEGSDILGD